MTDRELAELIWEALEEFADRECPYCSSLIDTSDKVSEADILAWLFKKRQEK